MIKGTAKTIKEKGSSIITRMHQNLVNKHKEFKTIFPEEILKDAIHMQKAVGLLHGYASNCDNMPVIEADISELVGILINVGVENDHYPLVAEALVEAIGTCLGSDTNAETVDAWKQALDFMVVHFATLSEEFKKNPYYKAWRLTPDTIEALKYTALEIKGRGNDIAKSLFDLLFTRYPVFKDIFPDENIQEGKMFTVLPIALHAFAANCDNIAAIDETLARIVTRHVDRNVQDWHYPMMEECLIGALRMHLEDDEGMDAMEAWKDGFKYLANKIMRLEDTRRNNPIIEETLSEAEAKAIQDSASAFSENGTAIIEHFYKVLFQKYPNFKNLFKEENVKNGSQVAAMVKVLHGFAVSPDNLENISEQVSHIVGRHVGRKLGVENWHYPLVGECLLEALKHVLGMTATPELLDAWKQGYKVLSAHFMKLEDEFGQNPYYQTWTLSPETITLLKQSAPIIKTKGDRCGERLFEYLFARYPSFKAMFPNVETTRMVDALPVALYTFAENCDNISVMDQTLITIAKNHVARGVQDWHYPRMEECLTDVLGFILDKDGTPAMQAAWKEGFKYLANQIMKLEDIRRGAQDKFSI